MVGIGIGLGGGRQRVKEKSHEEVNSTATQSQTSSQHISGVQTTLDAGTIATLQGIIQNIAPNIGQSADADMIRALSGQLATNLDPALVEANIQSSQAAAVRNFNMNQGAQIKNFEQLIGSKGNTFAQIIANQGNVDLATMLAQIADQTRLGAAAQRSADLGGAIQGTAAAAQVGQQPLNQLLAAIATLTGARTETSMDQQNLSNTVNNLNQITDTQGETFGRYFNHNFKGSIGAT